MNGELFTAANLGASVPGEHTDRKDRIFVPIAVILGILFCDFMLMEGLGISVPVYLALFYTAVFWYLAGRPGGIHKKGLMLLIPIGLLAACYGLYNNPMLAFFNYPLLLLLVALQLSAMTGNRLHLPASVGTALDALNATVLLPLTNLPAPFRALRKNAEASGKKASPVLIGLAIALPLLLIVSALLISADAVLEAVSKNVLDALHLDFGRLVLKVILGLVLCIPLSGLLFALRHTRAVQAEPLNLGRLRVADSHILSTVMLVLCAAYAVFIAVQFGYLFNAFASILPQGMTYAAYARRGFFELMGVVFINLCVLSLSQLISRRHGAGGGLLKAAEALLVVMTLLLISSAMAKMAMYISAYGLTPMRLYTSWFMLLCTSFFIGMAIKSFRGKFRLVRFCSAAFLVLYLGLNLAGVDGIIARVNIGFYQSGYLNSIDVDQLDELSDSMIPYAATLLDDKNETVRTATLEMLQHRADILDQNNWQGISLAREQAKQVLQQNHIKYVPLDYSED